ncbi:MAG: site-specific DNA-methyltransferase, partial [Cyanobacteria bacterium J06648_10]
AVTGNDWAHDWLIDQAENVVVMPTAQYSNDKLKQLLKLLSKPGDVVMLPWLPDAKMLATIHRLGRVVYAGERSVERCGAAIAASGLRATPIEPDYVAELVG